MPAHVAAWILLSTALLIAGCETTAPAPDGGGSAVDPNQPPITTGSSLRPAADATWQWQLQPNADGVINTSYDADVYDIDLFDASQDVIDALHADGRIVIAYFSAGTYEDFREDADEFASSDLGRALADYPNERWLDIRSSNVRRIMRARLDRAAQKRFDGVEPDNMTGFADGSGFPLTAADQLAFNRFIANEAHLRGLSVALKNDVEQIPQLVAYFDFAVNEQCHEYEECDAYAPFLAAGKPVFNAEYLGVYVNNAARRSALCADARAAGLATLVLPADLDDAFRFSCDAP